MEAFWNAAAKLSNVLPTGTFLVFQALAPSATNDGDCGVTEKVVTSIILVVLSALCCFSCFTDSYTDENANLHFGVVTTGGLWNPYFENSGLTDVQGSYYVGGGGTYVLSSLDFVNAGISVAALATLTLLTAPITTCFYPHIAGSIEKTVPLLVSLLVSAICAFTNFRRGLGFASSAAGAPGAPGGAGATPGDPGAAGATPGDPGAAGATPGATGAAGATPGAPGDIELSSL